MLYQDSWPAGTVVEYSTNNPNIEGSNPSPDKGRYAESYQDIIRSGLSLPVSYQKMVKVTAVQNYLVS